MLACIAAGLAVGCPRVGPGEEESEGDDPAGETDSGEPIDTLGPDELADLCTDLNDRMRQRFDNRRLVGFECTRIYVNSGDALSCDQAVTACVQQSPDAISGAPRPPEFVIDEAECNAIGTCPVGVDDFDTCIEDRFDQTDRLLLRMNCGIASDPEAVDALLSDLDAPLPIPASCASVQADCPDLL